MLSQDMLKLGQHRSVIREIFEYGNQRRREIGTEKVLDFSLGNPSVPTPEVVSESLKELIETVPAAELHAYTSAAGDLDVRNAVAEHICDRFGVPALGKHIYMTAGAAASLAISLKALVEPGDEVIAVTPYFPEYKVFAESAGAKFTVVQSAEGSLQIDGNALKKAVNENTKAVIINSPNNPSGVVYNRGSIEVLADVLKEASEKYGHRIFVICDEPYRELAYDGVYVPYIPKFYADTIVCYSYSKSLSLPGERIGYIFVSSGMKDADLIFDAVCGAGRALGYVCAPSLFQRLVMKCVDVLPDLTVYDENRKLLYNALTDAGFEVVYPDGAFYLFLKAPISDAYAFCEKAKEYELLLVPGDDFGCPGYVRIAYCVTNRQVLASLPAFRKLAQFYIGE